MSPGLSATFIITVLMKTEKMGLLENRLEQEKRAIVGLDRKIDNGISMKKSLYLILMGFESDYGRNLLAPLLSK